jgi:hypothetical protein
MTDEATTSYDPSPAQKLHGERVEARQRERADQSFFTKGKAAGDETGGSPAADAKAVARMFDELMGAILIIGVLSELEAASKPKPKPAPFQLGDFWLQLNEERKAAGKPEANYGEAREAFLARRRPDPTNAITFAGRRGVGIRAVPTLGNKYTSDFTDRSGNWSPVGGALRPTLFDTAEAALTAAGLGKAIHETRV